MIHLKSDKEIAQMRRAGGIVGTILSEMCDMAKPGISTGELDAYAERRIRELEPPRPSRATMAFRPAYASR